MGSTGSFPNDPSVLVSKSTTCLINWLVQTEMQGPGGKSTASVSSESTYRTYRNNVEKQKMIMSYKKMYQHTRKRGIEKS
jgi:hypothetical protein